METWVFILFFLGLALLATELLFLDGFLGILAALALVTSWILGFVEFGGSGGLTFLGSSFAFLVVTLALEYRFVLRSRWGRGFFNKGAVSATSHVPQGREDLIGKQGEALTTLAPSGLVVIENQRFEAFAVGGFMERGDRLQVTGFDNFRVKVRKIV